MRTTARIATALCLSAVTAVTGASAAQADSNYRQTSTASTVTVQTPTSTQFTNHATSKVSLGALKTKTGSSTAVRPGGKAPRGTKYLRVPKGFTAWYRGIDGRFTGPVWLKLNAGTFRVIITRTYIVKRA